jgi:hypothetical protein
MHRRLLFRTVFPVGLLSFRFMEFKKCAPRGSRGVLALAVVALVWGCADGGGDGADAGADGGADGGPSFLVEEELRVAAGGYLAFRVGAADGIELLDPADPYGALSEAARQAVDAAPEWTRERLVRTLSRLDGPTAEAIAAQLLAAAEPLRDEVAWSVSVTDAPLLSWIVGQGAEDLFVENAQAVYAMDGLLGYAQLVELADGRTTLHVVGAESEYDLEPEMYYWYVVYPRAYFELPTRVDGEFWRTFLTEDDLYGTALLDAVADAADVNAAALLVGEWIQGFMTFGYGSDDLEPIDIYDAHYGSCGEYSILTTAAARTVLVPTASVSARADDHEWNEYWDERWIMWDNSLGDITGSGNPHYPYIDWAEIYDDDLTTSGVLGQVAQVFRYRPDDAIFPSEVVYTPTAEVDVAVRDALGEPVEGARVIVTTVESGGLPCTWGYTGVDGTATFTLGNDLGYWVEVSHELLGAPGDPPMVGTDQPGPIPVEVALDLPYPRAFESAGDAVGDVGLALDLTVIRTTQHRINEITEDYELGLTHEIELEGGLIDVYLLDEDGFAAFAAGEPFAALSPVTGTSEAALDLSVSAQAPRYVVLDNRMWPVSDKTVSVRLELAQ